MSEAEIKTVTPMEIFTHIKEGLGILDKMALKRYTAVAHKLLQKAEITNQKALKNRLEFRIQTLAKEIELVQDYGINQYVDSEKIFDYIEQTEAREVVITSVSNYMREIPDEAIEKMEKTKGIFDEFLILFTDYTGEVAKQADEIVKEKDPILFGVFYDGKHDEYVERYYFLYDWEDEYCDLTLDKLIMEYKDISDEEIVYVTETDLFKATKALKKEAEKGEG